MIHWFVTGNRDDILGQNWSPMRYTGSVMVTVTIYWFSSDPLQSFVRKCGKNCGSKFEGGGLMIYWDKWGYGDDILVQL